MSDSWFNLRILLWHFTVQRGRLFRLRVSLNPYWVQWRLLWRPIWLHEFDPSRGWQCRHDTPTSL